MNTLVRSRLAEGLRAIAYSVPFGYPHHATAALPDRLYCGLDGAARPVSFIPMEPDADVEHLPSPVDFLLSSSTENWSSETRRTLARLEALWLLIEDRHHLLDVEAIDPLAHQASLVEHVLASDMRRLLLADEVGLGKTVEAGLIIKRLSEAASGKLRVLYLTEARLVENVCREFRKLGLKPRRWTSEAPEARLEAGDSDSLVVASMHRAVFRVEGGVNHFETVATSGPWDVIIVDEAHHLTDWSPDGTDPQQRMRLVRRLISERLVKDGRVLLLTGTPHQGHGGRFKNLLRLLDEGLEDERAARGKIIYRIKEDIHDWEGRPLFPGRRVASPTLLDVGPTYRAWFAEVHALLTPDAGTRTGAWRRAQALQWCASSPQAGLAYLARMAARMGFTIGSLPALRSALLALRPYRGGSPDESAASLEQRILAGLDVADEPADEGPASTKPHLARVLEMGVQLVNEDAIAPKIRAVEEKLDATPDEKLVVFAQPVETVHLLAHRLEARLGPGSVALIVGGQGDEERTAIIDRFQDPRGARVLVSSRSGGEGINLQIARRLIHFDVPWNPMDMEQRVGRIHRYGSVDTILVDTLVLSGSREERVLARCRARLAQIARDVDQDRFDLLFSRTMALIPLEELEQLMAAEMFGQLTTSDAERLDLLVQEGYRKWQAADAEFRSASVKLRTLERGTVGENDLRAFVENALEARAAKGWKRRFFEEVPGSGEPRLTEADAEVFRLADGSFVSFGLQGGMAVPPAGVSSPPRRIGLNDPAVCERLRARVGGADRNGKGGERWVSGAGSCLIARSDLAAWVAVAGVGEEHGRGFILLGYAVRYLEPASLAREVSSELKWYACAEGREPSPLTGDAAARLMRLLREPRPRRTPPSHLIAWNLAAAETLLLAKLRQVDRGQPMPVVFPVAAVHIEAD